MMTIKTDKGNLPIAETFDKGTIAVAAGYKYYFRNYDGNTIYIKTLKGNHCKFAVVSSHNLYLSVMPRPKKQKENLS